ncbi:YibE/F-like protein [compost metagenome]
MGTMTNTLILAFTGASINILIMLFMYNIQYIQLINLDMLVVEVIQGLSGSIAVVLSIPVTALLSAKILGASTVKELEI